MAQCLCEKTQWLSRRHKGTEEERWPQVMMLALAGPSAATIRDSVAPCLCEKKTMALTEAQRHGGRALTADDDACKVGSFNPDDEELCGSVPL